MEAATCSPSLHYCTSLSLDKQGRRSNDFLRFSATNLQTLSSKGLKSSRVQLRPKLASFELSCYNNCQAPALELEKTTDYLDGPFILKKKSQDVTPYLHNRCVYLVGMMGSGKTTVGKILSEVLGYSFLDSDKLVEQAVGVTSVAQIFKDYSEGFFRDNESEVLRELTSMTKLVVATGGGAVIRPINWKYMKQGITVWLDVPLEALARRIAAVGTDSRPLLHGESGDPYTKALTRLSRLSEERGEAYANADARVCLENIAAKLGHGDVNNLTPTTIAVEVLIQMENFLKGGESMTIRR